MENYIIANQYQYFDCANRLQHLMNKHPQTEGIKKEMEMIKAAIEEFKKNYVKKMVSLN